MSISGLFALRCSPPIPRLLLCFRSPAGIEPPFPVPGRSPVRWSVPYAALLYKETFGSPKFPSYPFEHMPWSSGRNTARAPLGKEFPTCTLSVVQRVPSSAIDHVSASPPLIPDGRISRVRLAASDLHALSPKSLPILTEA